MKQLILLIFLLISTSSFAAQKNIEERIRHAAEILGSIADQSQEFSVAPNEAKKMLLQVAFQEWQTDAEEFESHWTTNGDMWEVDASAWGETNSEGAYSYISENLEQTLQDSEKTQEDKVKFADGTLQMNKAFNILNSIKSVRYGVAPMGAVQCGVRFPALLILDTENGKVYSIIMEGSGC